MESSSTNLKRDYEDTPGSEEFCDPKFPKIDLIHNELSASSADLVLPVNILNRILTSLPIVEKVRISRVSRLFKELILAGMETLTLDELSLRAELKAHRLTIDLESFVGKIVEAVGSSVKRLKLVTLRSSYNCIRYESVLKKFCSGVEEFEYRYFSNLSHKHISGENFPYLGIFDEKVLQYMPQLQSLKALLAVTSHNRDFVMDRLKEMKHVSYVYLVKDGEGFVKTWKDAIEGEAGITVESIRGLYFELEPYFEHFCQALNPPPTPGIPAEDLGAGEKLPRNIFQSVCVTTLRSLALHLHTATHAKTLSLFVNLTNLSLSYGADVLGEFEFLTSMTRLERLKLVSLRDNLESKLKMEDLEHLCKSAPLREVSFECPTEAYALEMLAKRGYPLESICTVKRFGGPLGTVACGNATITLLNSCAKSLKLIKIPGDVNFLRFSDELLKNLTFILMYPRLGKLEAMASVEKFVERRLNMPQEGKEALADVNLVIDNHEGSSYRWNHLEERAIDAKVCIEVIS